MSSCPHFLKYAHRRPMIKWLKCESDSSKFDAVLSVGSSFEAPHKRMLVCTHTEQSHELEPNGLKLDDVLASGEYMNRIHGW